MRTRRAVLIDAHARARSHRGRQAGWEDAESGPQRLPAAGQDDVEPCCVRTDSICEKCAQLQRKAWVLQEKAAAALAKALLDKSNALQV